MRDLAAFLADGCGLFVRSAREASGRRVVLDVLRDGAGLRLSHDGPRAVAPVGPLADAAWADVLRACLTWSLEVQAAGDARRRVLEGEGARVAAGWRTEPAWPRPGLVLRFSVDGAAVAGELQSPEVLFALRDEAARTGGVALVVRLPSGTRW